MKQDNSDTQVAWNVATKAIAKGKFASIAGPFVGYFTSLCTLFIAACYLLGSEGNVRVVGVIVSLASTLASLVAGQLVGLYGLRGMMHGFETQNWVLDQDLDE